jgi:ELWxxDGT repeat protein
MHNHPSNAMTNNMKTIAQIACIALLAVTSAAAQLVPNILKNINDTDQVSSSPRGMTNVSGKVFFSAEDGLHGRELWHTTGQINPTQLLKDINPNGNSNPANFCNVNGTVFFTANNGSGVALWKTDGTTAGTVFVKDVFSGSADDQIAQLTACNGKLFFSALAATNVPAGVVVCPKLYVSDGTAAGTQPLGTNVFSPQNLTAVGSTLFFSAGASPTNSNIELFKSNGSSAGTSMVAEINAGPASSEPRNLLNVNGTLFFSANNGAANGRQIWKTTTNPLQPVQRLSSLQVQGFPGANIGEIAHLNGTVFFTAHSGFPATGFQLHRVNQVGTSQLNPVAIAQNLTACNGRLFFTQTAQNGAIISFVTANSNVVTDLRSFPVLPGEDNFFPKNFTVLGTTLFFNAGTSLSGRELWHSDGTANGTKEVQDFLPGSVGSNPSDLCVFGNSLLFASTSTSEANEMRRFVLGNNIIFNFANIGRAGSFPTEFTGMRQKTYFAADNGVDGRELWVSDGTEAGTQMLKNINPNGASSNPDNFIVVTSGGVSMLFFVADNGTHGRELWKSDGTADGTVRISDIAPNGGNAGIGNMTNVNGRLHFTAVSGFSTGDRIFRTNTALTGVQTTGGAMSNANSLVAIGSTLFFTQSPQIGGPLLCKLSAGITTTVKTFALIPGGEYPMPQKLMAVGNVLFFTAATAQHGRELWKSNGTTNGTVRISDILPNEQSAGIGNMTDFNGVLHFTASSGTSLGDRIFKTNTNLTEVVAAAGNEVGVIQIAAAQTHLYYLRGVHGPNTGPTLCKVENGTTTELKTFDFLPFSQSFSPLQMHVAVDRLFFNMANGNDGQELWTSSGTPASTQMLGNFNGPGNANIREMRFANADLYLSIYLTGTGQEPFVIKAVVPQVSSESSDRSAETEPAPAAAVDIDLKIYPNPASDVVRVDFPENETGGTLQIVAFNGQMLRSAQTAEGDTSLEINIQDLPKGAYFVRWVRQNNPMMTKKLLVQRAE